MDILGDDSHHQNELEKTTNKDDSNLFDITDPKPKDEQRDECRGRHIADKAHHGFCKSLGNLEGPHDQSDGDSDNGSNDKPHHHPIHTVEDIGGESQIEKEINSRLEDSSLEMEEIRDRQILRR